MGVICILLGIIIFLGFVGAGAALANVVISFKNVFAQSMVALADVSNTGLLVGIIGVCGFIGLLIGLNLVMHGLTYNKVCKLAKRRQHRDS